MAAGREALTGSAEEAAQGVILELAVPELADQAETRRIQVQAAQVAAAELEFSGKALPGQMVLQVATKAAAVGLAVKAGFLAMLIPVKEETEVNTAAAVGYLAVLGQKAEHQERSASSGPATSANSHPPAQQTNKV